jgi:putative PEP-CTERM system histidine kinase
MQPSISYVLHGACAACFGVVATRAAASARGRGAQYLLTAACLITALWAVSTASPHVATLWLEIARPVVWYAYAYCLLDQSFKPGRTPLQLLAVIALALPCVTGALIQTQAAQTPFLLTLHIIALLGLSVCNVLLLENLYFNTPVESRWHINLLCVALGGIFIYDLVYYADGLLYHRLSPIMAEARMPVAILAAPLLAVSIRRNRRWKIDLRLSHDVAFHSLTLIGSGIFLLAIGLISSVFRGGDSEWGRVAQTTLIFSAILVISIVMTSGSTRSRIRNLIADNFFRNRYDYRKEWMRCIDALTAPDAFVALQKRAIRAAAHVVDSPAGMLFVRAPEDVAFQWAGSWNMAPSQEPISPGHPLVAAFKGGEWIVRLDDLASPECEFTAGLRAWIALPLSHFGALIGFIVLAQPRVPFQLDREAFDLLRVIGREIGSRLAEQRAVQVLAQTQQLREYSQRFAFVIHDIKNVSGQLSMLLANAEAYAADPAFQRDMLTTVRASVGKIDRLLSRLQARQQERTHGVIAPVDRLRPLIAACQATRQRQIRLHDYSDSVGAAIDPDAFEAIVTHVLNNAAEASPPGTAVSIELRVETPGLIIEIVDQGQGMSAEFVRDELFRPLRTTKGGGHGIGAFQSRELARDAGGDLLVLSRPGSGTSVQIVLPLIKAGILEPAES